MTRNSRLQVRDAPNFLSPPPSPSSPTMTPFPGASSSSSEDESGRPAFSPNSAKISHKECSEAAYSTQLVVDLQFKSALVALFRKNGEGGAKVTQTEVIKRPTDNSEH